MWQYDVDTFPDDICDDDLLHGFSQVSLGQAVVHHSYVGVPMDQQTAMVGDWFLRFLVLGLIIYFLLAWPLFFLGLKSCSPWFQLQVLHRRMEESGLDIFRRLPLEIWPASEQGCFHCHVNVNCLGFLINIRAHILNLQGGPCGVLACVQAFVLKNLLFESIQDRNAGPK